MLLLFVIVASFIVISFLGHVVHWALHQRWTGPAHHGHMSHHLGLYPPGDMTSDTYRSPRWYHGGALLFTPPLIIVLGAIGGLLWAVGMPHWVVGVFGIILIGFGLTNDYMHDSYHIRKHVLQRFGWYRCMRRLHFIHHVDMRANYGITVFVWDRVFGTKRVS